MNSKQFSCIVIDPPWRYRDKGIRGAAEHHYSTMSLDQMAELPIWHLGAKNSHMWLWITNSMLKAGAHKDLLTCWGYEPKTIVTWCKVYPSGKPYIGLGHYLRNSTEHLIFAVRGKLPVKQRNVPTWFTAVVNTKIHSYKPQEAFDIIERISPGPRLELFARAPRKGWEVWGNEVKSKLHLGNEGWEWDD